MVECDLAKVEVASSNLVSRSKSYEKAAVNALSDSQPPFFVVYRLGQFSKVIERQNVSNLGTPPPERSRKGPSFFFFFAWRSAK